MSLVINPWPKHYVMGSSMVYGGAVCVNHSLLKSDEHEKVETFRFGSVLPDSE